jgi:hypothetical protein
MFPTVQKRNLWFDGVKQQSMKMSLKQNMARDVTPSVSRHEWQANGRQIFVMSMTPAKNYTPNDRHKSSAIHTTQESNEDRRHYEHQFIPTSKT